MKTKLITLATVLLSLIALLSITACSDVDASGDNPYVLEGSQIVKLNGVSKQFDASRNHSLTIWGETRDGKIIIESYWRARGPYRKYETVFLP